MVMIWCTRCEEDCSTVRDPDKCYICCAGCGKVIAADFYTDQPTSMKYSRGNILYSFRNKSFKSERSYSAYREKTLQKESKNSTPVVTTLKATRQMLKKKTFSSRVNYEALEGLYNTDNEKVKKQGGESETSDNNGKAGTIQKNEKSSSAGDLQKGDVTGKFEEEDFEGAGDRQKGDDTGMGFCELLDIPQGNRRRKYHGDVTVMVTSLEGRIWKSSGKCAWHVWDWAADVVIRERQRPSAYR